MTHDFLNRFLLHLVSLQGGCLLILHQRKFPLRRTGDHMDVLVSKVVLTHRRRRRRCQIRLLESEFTLFQIRRSSSTSFNLLNADDFFGVEF